MNKKTSASVLRLTLKKEENLSLGFINKSTFILPLETLKKHFVALGASGSGKTVICKTIIEEAALKKIPSIIIDPQGDLASLSLLDESAPEEIKKGFENVKISIFTPTSSKGIPICINPLKLPNEKLEYEDLVSILNQISSAICSLIGLDIEKDDGKSAQATFFLILKYCYDNQLELSNFDELSGIIQNIPEEINRDISHFLTSGQEKEKLIKKLKFLTIGEKELLFEYGIPLDINLLLGKSRKEINKTDDENKKTQISIIYLNTLESQEDKEFFVSMLATKLYEWMLLNPSKEIQALFYIDEISSYLPAGALKPISKPILTLIFKQARKYGIGCLMSTQNPGDVDYKAFAQIGTWAIGRLTTEQDRNKIKNAITTISKQRHSSSEGNIVKILPTLEPGNFVFFCPDVSKKTLKIKVRKLYTKHLTLTEKDIKDITNNNIRKSYEPYFIKKSKKMPFIQKNTPDINFQNTFDKKIIKLKNTTLKQNIADDVAKESLKKNMQKNFLNSFLNKKQKIEFKKYFEPVLFLTIRRAENGLFKKIIREYHTFIDINLQNIFDIKNNKKYTGIAEILNLNERDVDVIKEILKSNEITKEKIMEKLGLDEKEFKIILETLKKKKLLAVESSKNTPAFSLLFEMTIPKSPSSIDQRNIDFESDTLSSVQQPQINIDEKTIDALSLALNFWFGNCAIIKYSIALCPIFEAEAIDKTGKVKKVILNGYNGKLRAL